MTHHDVSSVVSVKHQSVTLLDSAQGLIVSYLHRLNALLLHDIRRRKVIAQLIHLNISEFNHASFECRFLLRVVSVVIVSSGDLHLISHVVIFGFFFLIFNERSATHLNVLLLFQKHLHRIVFMFRLRFIFFFLNTRLIKISDVNLPDRYLDHFREFLIDLVSVKIASLERCPCSTAIITD